METLKDHPEIQSFLNKVTDDLKFLLKNNLLGVYVWGSLATHSYKEGLSDIDVLVVVRHQINAETLSTLQKWAESIVKLEKYAGKLDAAFVSLDTINASDGTTSCGGIEFWKGIVQKIDNSLGDNPLVLDTVRKVGISLFGPPAEDLIHPVSREKILNSLKKELRELRAGVTLHFNDIGWRYYAITTLCRVLYTNKTGDYTSKQEALSWYREVFNSKYDTVIQSAVAYYNGDDSEIKKTQQSDYVSFIEEVENMLVT